MIRIRKLSRAVFTAFILLYSTTAQYHFHQHWQQGTPEKCSEILSFTPAHPNDCPGAAVNNYPIQGFQTLAQADTDTPRQGFSSKSLDCFPCYCVHCQFNGYRAGKITFVLPVIDLIDASNHPGYSQRAPQVLFPPPRTA